MSTHTSMWSDFCCETRLYKWNFVYFVIHCIMRFLKSQIVSARIKSSSVLLFSFFLPICDKRLSLIHCLKWLSTLSTTDVSTEQHNCSFVSHSWFYIMDSIPFHLKHRTSPTTHNGISEYRWCSDVLPCGRKDYLRSWSFPKSDSGLLQWLLLVTFNDFTSWKLHST